MEAFTIVQRDNKFVFLSNNVYLFLSSKVSIYLTKFILYCDYDDILLVTHSPTQLC